jgi:hypothetical protein
MRIVSFSVVALEVAAVVEEGVAAALKGAEMDYLFHYHPLLYHLHYLHHCFLETRYSGSPHFRH